MGRRVADVRQLLPEPADLVAADLVAELRTAQRNLEPFAPAVVEFAADLSRRLRRDPSTRAAPALLALSFWIRPASIQRLQDDWDAAVTADPSLVRVPQGVVFHIPPSNVDTLFVYSWLLSALCGNANIIRLSESAVENSAPLIEAVGEALRAHPAVARTTSIVVYGHERSVTEALSGGDVRVIWGGDQTVQAIRAIPAAPSTSELAFPDRYSMCLLDSASVVALDDEQMTGIAQRFFNDAYWFDQLGCASPRLVVWHGTEDAADAARPRFHKALRAEIVAKGADEVPTSAVIAKLVHAADAAAAGAVSEVDWSHNEMTTARLDELDRLARDSPGGGLFYELVVDDIDELLPFVTRQDQTLTHYGLGQEALVAFARRLGARGIDRIVPVGEALTFGRYWDGRDLLASFTRTLPVLFT